MSRNLNRKHGLSSSGLTSLGSDSTNHIDKEPRTSTSNSTSARDLVLQAKDLLVKAYTYTSFREEQSKLLDLLEIFREYTEKGRIQAVSSILASQVSNLKVASR